MEQSCLREFIKYALFNIMGMLGLSCYILADTFFISKGLGTTGLAALNLAIPIYSLVHGCGLMLGMGGATRYTIYKGQGNNENSDRVFTNTIYLTMILAFFFVLTGSFLSEKITRLLGANAEVFEMTNTYIKMILLFSPFFLMNEVLICFVRNDGSPQLAMMAMLGGSFSNVGLDYIFIFPLGMGIFGAVLATGIAPIISILIISQYFWKKKHKFHLKKGKMSTAMTKDTVLLGFPSLVSEVSSGLVIIIFNMIILHLQGNVGIAAYGIIANLSLVVVAIYTGVAQGIQPLVSKAYGSGDFVSIKQVLRYAIILLLIISSVIYLTVFFFANPIASIFNNENHVQLQQIATSGLKIYFIAAPFVGFNIIIAMFFTSIDKVIPAHAISLLRGFILIVPMVFLFSFFFEMIGVWLTFPMTEFLVAILGSFFYIKISRQLHHEKK